MFRKSSTSSIEVAGSTRKEWPDELFNYFFTQIILQFVFLLIMMDFNGRIFK